MLISNFYIHSCNPAWFHFRGVARGVARGVHSQGCIQKFMLGGGANYEQVGFFVAAI